MKKTKPTPSINCAHTAVWPLRKFKPNPKNPNRHPEPQLKLLGKIIQEQGWRSPIVVSKRSGLVVKGHGRLEAARMAGLKEAPVDLQSYASSGLEWADMIADNRLAELADMDLVQLKFLLDDLGTPYLLGLTGYTDADLKELLANIADDADAAGASARTLAEKFGVPPFSVLDARQGYWQDRKRAWLALGIESEVGRGDNLLKMSDTILAAGNKGKAKTFSTEGNVGGEWTGTSIFDPVLCELAYRWFAPPNATILDPFAGGSVRGITAALLGHTYIGFELRPEQVKANQAQAERIIPATDKCVRPFWVAGDSKVELPKFGGKKPGDPENQADFIFSCPPYGSLEKYSDDPADLSNMSYDRFLVAYQAIILAAVDRLRPGCLACFVVGDFRDKDGCYHNFVSHTIAAFADAGAHLYNEAILVTAVGTLPLRISRQFATGRKLGKTHQNVLVFLKGNSKSIRAWPVPDFGHDPIAQLDAAPPQA